MKRALAIGVLLAVVVSFAVLLKSPGPKAPQFNRLQALPSLEQSLQISYDFLGPRPFDGGEMWIYVASSRTTSKAFLFDSATLRIPPIQLSPSD